ncbi:hypothetical protein PtB15_3B447 [Puccinia triticina]|nr:hypothetical protein PtB15_3B447 [Puccinia triticina]
MSYRLSSSKDSEDDQPNKGRYTTKNARQRPPVQQPEMTNSQESLAGPRRHTERDRLGTARRTWPVFLRGSVAAAAAVATGRHTSSQVARRPGVIPPMQGGTPSFQPNPRRQTTEVPARGAAITFPNHEITRTIHDDEPVNNDFLGELETVFDLRGSYADMAENMALVPPARQFAVQVYSQMAMRQALDAARQEIVSIARAPAPAAAAGTNQTAGFQYAQVFKLLTGIQEVPGRDINHPVPSILALLAEVSSDFK